MALRLWFRSTLAVSTKRYPGRIAVRSLAGHDSKRGPFRAHFAANAPRLLPAECETAPPWSWTRRYVGLPWCAVSLRTRSSRPSSTTSSPGHCDPLRPATVWGRAGLSWRDQNRRLSTRHHYGRGVAPAQPPFGGAPAGPGDPVGVLVARHLPPPLRREEQSLLRPRGGSRSLARALLDGRRRLRSHDCPSQCGGCRPRGVHSRDLPRRGRAGLEARCTQRLAPVLCSGPWPSRRQRPPLSFAGPARSPRGAADPPGPLVTRIGSSLVPELPGSGITPGWSRTRTDLAYGTCDSHGTRNSQPSRLRRTTERRRQRPPAVTPPLSTLSRSPDEVDEEEANPLLDADGPARPSARPGRRGPRGSSGSSPISRSPPSASGPYGRIGRRS